MGLQPELRVERINEDVAELFMSSEARARKHEASKQHSAIPQATHDVSALPGTSRDYQLQDSQAKVKHSSDEHG